MEEIYYVYICLHTDSTDCVLLKHVSCISHYFIRGFIKIHHIGLWNNIDICILYGHIISDYSLEVF